MCGHCGESFYHANDLKKHYDTVHGEFKCFNCGLSFSQKSKLMAHIMKRDQDNKCENQEKHTSVGPGNKLPGYPEIQGRGVPGPEPVF